MDEWLIYLQLDDLLFPVLNINEQPIVNSCRSATVWPRYIVADRNEQEDREVEGLIYLQLDDLLFTIYRSEHQPASHSKWLYSLLLYGAVVIPSILQFFSPSIYLHYFIH